MLKHEEMIENVHRRIAQYEEEKKMKHSTFKNIISAIKPNTKKEETKTNQNEQTEGTNDIETKENIIIEIKQENDEKEIKEKKKEKIEEKEKSEENENDIIIEKEEKPKENKKEIIT